MANEYAQLADLKQMLNIQPTDTTRDVLLNMALTSASRSIDQNTGRRFFLDDTATARVYNPSGRVVLDNGGERLTVDDIGVAPVAVEYGYNGAWTPVIGWESAPDNSLAKGRPITSLVQPYGTWGYGILRIRITAQWGWPAVPDEIAQAALILAARLYRRKDSPEGVTGTSEWGVIRLSRQDPDVWNLIQHYVSPGFG